eukprot:TRINITY_DN25458_c0_g1_i2.p1 TRINITY_DN25458_c0_g1~~TRINITY_DN25458_c0_g1_i2.p1  ORF type:complete len:949 (+),score=99.37 TRINITY_DN25458_c0_g1_i2:237-3083(+)
MVPPGLPAMKAMDTLYNYFPQAAPICTVGYVELACEQREDGCSFEAAGTHKWLEKIRDLVLYNDVAFYDSYFETAFQSKIRTQPSPHRYITPDGTAILFQVCGRPDLLIDQRIQFIMATYNPSPGRLQAGVTSRQLLIHGTIEAVKRDLPLIDGLCVPAAFTVMGLMLRSVRLLLLAGINLFVACFTTFAILYFICAGFNFTPDPTQVNFVSMIALGLNFDYSLFLLSRFATTCRQDTGGLPPATLVEKAVLRSLETVCPVIVSSGLTLSLVFCGFLFLSAGNLFAAGMACAVTTFVVMCSTLTALPAVLMMCPGFWAIPPTFYEQPATPMASPRDGMANLQDHDCWHKVQPDEAHALRTSRQVATWRLITTWPTNLVVVVALHVLALFFGWYALGLQLNNDITEVAPRGDFDSPYATFQRLRDFSEAFADDMSISSAHDAHRRPHLRPKPPPPPQLAARQQTSSAKAKAAPPAGEHDPQKAARRLASDTGGTFAGFIGYTDPFLVIIEANSVLDRSKMNRTLGRKLHAWDKAWSDDKIQEAQEDADKDAEAAAKKKRSKQVKIVPDGPKANKEVLKQCGYAITANLSKQILAIPAERVGFQLQPAAVYAPGYARGTEINREHASNWHGKSMWEDDSKNHDAIGYFSDTYKLCGGACFHQPEAYGAAATLVHIMLPVHPGSLRGGRWIKEVYRLLEDFQSSHQNYECKGRLMNLTLSLADVHGTVIDHDMMEETFAEFTMMLPITCMLIFALIGFFLRSAFVPLRLALTLVLPVCSVFGLAVLVFQEGVLDFLGIDNVSGSKDKSFHWEIPIVSFAMTIALALDYDLFVIIRITDYRFAGYSIQASILRALHETGPVVTGAGLMMAFTFGGNLLAESTTLNQGGWILATGVLIDTFVVRTALVPALLSLADSAAWWPSKPPLTDLRDEYGNILDDNAEPVYKPEFAPL